MFSPAVVWNDIVFCSGATGSDPATGEIVEGGVKAQSRKALENLALVAEEAGSSLADVLRVTVYLIDIEGDIAAMNEVFAEVFPVDPPARSTIGVAGLARPGLLVEMDMMAAIRG
ncbi:MAG: RidA family protein [Actinomycetota bacterium]|nr:RidA family protein [Actinomycetota bacterium]